MDLTEEVRNGYLISSEMKKVWSVQMELLKKLLFVCDKYNLKIWADSGTLIGTVREKGFIPWDDDIDMIMMRNDYDKLISISEKEFNDPYFLQSAYSESKYPRGHAQLRMRGTAAILPNDMDQSFDQSIFLDIFVYDAVPENQDLMDSLIRKIEKQRDVLISYCYGHLSLQHPKMSLFLIYKKFRNLFFSFQSQYKIFEDLCRKYSIEEDSRIYFLGLNTKKVSTRNIRSVWYKNTLWLPFEDILMPVPADYDTLLKVEYGDYMKPSQAPSMHGDLIFDVNRSYVDVIKDIKSGKLSLDQYK